MTDLSSIMQLSSDGMRAQSTRLRHVSENIANADTPGYRRKFAVFDANPNTATTQNGVLLGPVQLDRTALAQIHNPSHPLADTDGNYDGSNVDLIIEIADAREAQRSYEANLKMFDHARQMSQRVLELLRK